MLYIYYIHICYIYIIAYIHVRGQVYNCEWACAFRCITFKMWLCISARPNAPQVASVASGKLTVCELENQHLQ